MGATEKHRRRIRKLELGTGDWRLDTSRRVSGLLDDRAMGIGAQPIPEFIEGQRSVKTLPAFGCASGTPPSKERGGKGDSYTHNTQLGPERVGDLVETCTEGIASILHCVTALAMTVRTGRVTLTPFTLNLCTQEPNNPEGMPLTRVTNNHDGSECLWHDSTIQPINH